MFNITLTVSGTLFPTAGNVLSSDVLNPSEYPFIVSLVLLKFMGGRQAFRACTGSVLNPHWILSCAHCLKKKYDMGFVSYRNETSSNNMVTKLFERVTTSPEYNLKDENIVVSNDLALIRVDEIYPKEFAKLSKFHYQYLPGVDLVYAGFGMHDPKNNTRLKAPVRKAKGVGRTCPDSVLKSGSRFICVEPVNVDAANALDGDSGGPLFHKGQIVGLMAGVRRKKTMDAIVFTPIVDHLNWIDHIIYKRYNVFDATDLS